MKSVDYCIEYVFDITYGQQVAEMFAETRAELDEFHHASKELEAELENELQRTEKAQQELKIKVARTESEKDEWKSKFLNLQTTHNTTTASLQRELDKLRQEHQHLKVQLRELELGNDDLERNERAVSSSLADMEAKYSKALEEKILLEHELLEKAKLEEENQRLKDELRDANDEISIMKDQISNLANAAEKASLHTPSSSCPQSGQSSSEDLLRMSPPPDLRLSDLSPSKELEPSIERTPKAALVRQSDQATIRLPNKPRVVTAPGAILSTSRYTETTSYSSTAIPKTPTSRIAARNVLTSGTTSTASTASKNKGVQMVSEMRARVRNLEQKIQTRVPRLRMGSITNRTNSTNSMTTPTEGVPVRSPSSSSYASSKVSTAMTSWENLIQRQSIESKRSYESDAEMAKRNLADTSGWVLIMEDSPSPAKGDKARRRTSSPSAPSAYRTPIYSSNVTEASLARSMMNTGLRRPSSRLSGSNLSTSTTSSTLPTPTSRPTTPTFLPIPSGSSHIPGLGLKRSTGPNTPKPYTLKPVRPPTDFFRSTVSSPTRSNSETPSSVSSTKCSSEDEKPLPMLSSASPSRTSKLAMPSNALAQSRIGRPRKSTGDPDLIFKLQMEKRKRAGSNFASKHGVGS
ncbi:hypothetical protein M378DRAFT_175121 [Amanita muscaria Koide BX008]|uniref:NUDE domain-containing protein n=1 Tax=Amanita muscaria (strain Koide BX008) TaxID=946122 RepID=A0A0C2TTS3_AMAMK|nr:hypothetical protein M378DRAFT_175121 [Amanita muscaria Koide BX008]